MLLVERIIEKNPDLVLLDYFDTIVERTVNPESIKQITAKKLSGLIDNKVCYSEIYCLRAELERRLCEQNHLAGYDLEFNFDILSNQMAKILSDKYNIEKKKINQWIIDIELGTECSVQRLNQDVLTLINKLRERKTPIYLVSDFYLSKTLFLGMLNYHSIHSFFERIYISADNLLTKRSGRQYEVIKKDLPSSISKIVMVGDNYEADYKQAKEKKIYAFHIDRSEKQTFYRRKEQNFAKWGMITSKIRNEIKEKNSKDIFPELSLSLFYFISLLHRRLVRDGHKDVFFLSREGKFLKKQFDYFQDSMGYRGSSRLKTHYFYVSRRASFIASLKSLDEENFEILFRQYICMSLSEFLMNFQLDDLIETLAKALDVSAKERFDNFPQNPVFQKLKNNPVFREAYESKRKEQFEAFCSYISSFGCKNKNHSSMAIVDVGWKGTIQDNIFNLLSQGGTDLTGFKKIYGYYIGLIAPGNKNDHNQKIPIVFSCVDYRTDGFEFYNENRSLFEVVLAADHGSVKGYALNEKGVGEPCFEDFLSEKELFEKKVSPLQKRLWVQFQKVVEIFKEEAYLDSNLYALVTRSHSRMVLKATKAEIDWIISIFHIENFGVFEKSYFSVSSPWKLKDRILFTYFLLKNRSVDSISFWPWMTIRERGIPFLHKVYALWRLRNLP